MMSESRRSLMSGFIIAGIVSVVLLNVAPMALSLVGLLEHDSGWVDIHEKAGQCFNITHNLNSTNVMVDITGKTTVDGGVHQKYLGGTDFVAGWNKTYGGTDGEAALGLVQTKDGGYALGGYTSWTTPTPWLMKTGSGGNMQWNRTYGGAGDTFYFSPPPLVQTIDGGYAIAFMRQASGAGSYDFWLVRTDAFGTMMWNQTYGGSDLEYLGSMIQTREGGFAIVGMTSSFGGDDAYLVVTDSMGNMLWNKTYGGSNGDSFTDIVQTGDGFAMAGMTYSYGAGDRDMWLVKTNASGYMQWYKTYGTWAGEDSSALIQTFDGGYAIVGTIHYGNSYAKDMWFVKTDASGNKQWSHAFGTPDPGHEMATDVVQTSDGSYTLTGHGAPVWDLPYDAWLIRTDASGNKLWDRRYGGTGYDCVYCLIVSADGGYAMAGHTDSYGTSQDAWLIKTDAAGNVLDGFKYGLAWVDSTANSITLYRGTDDAYWNYVRVRIWKIQALGVGGVGGFTIPIDKLALVAPYIVLSSTIILAISISVAYIKYRKKQ